MRGLCAIKSKQIQLANKSFTNVMGALAFGFMFSLPEITRAIDTTLFLLIYVIRANYAYVKPNDVATLTARSGYVFQPKATN